jgi:hypothetical protein
MAVTDPTKLAGVILPVRSFGSSGPTGSSTSTVWPEAGQPEVLGLTLGAIGVE